MQKLHLIHTKTPSVLGATDAYLTHLRCHASNHAATRSDELVRVHGLFSAHDQALKLIMGGCASAESRRAKEVSLQYAATFQALGLSRKEISRMYEFYALLDKGIRRYACPHFNAKT